MLAAKNETIGRAISGVWQLTEEEQIREQCRAREDWIINARWKTEKIAEQAETIAEQKGTIAEQKGTIASMEEELAKYREQFGPLKKETE